MKLLLFLLLAAQPAWAQTNESATAPTPTQQALERQVEAYEKASQQFRQECVNDRRIICGRIVQIQSNGFVVDSGYTNLLREPLVATWFVPGSAVAARATNLIESKEPGSPCVGLVFVTDTPKSRRSQPKLFDYLIINAYPSGTYDYISAGTVQRTIRRFSAVLNNAVRDKLDLAGIRLPFTPPPAAKKP